VKATCQAHCSIAYTYHHFMTSQATMFSDFCTISYTHIKYVHTCTYHRSRRASDRGCRAGRHVCIYSHTHTHTSHMYIHAPTTGLGGLLIVDAELDDTFSASSRSSRVVFMPCLSLGRLYSMSEVLYMVVCVCVFMPCLSLGRLYSMSEVLYMVVCVYMCVCVFMPCLSLGRLYSMSQVLYVYMHVCVYRCVSV
jgi:hypothetical protein